ncbi:winged helix-turn-helix transcriptional regulator [Flavobacteriaceae bacterium AU392]|nr:LuxR family transcriptional regulator [Flavobacteriaceae bacterium]RKM86152.1 winged helix-turn-helix transcriptional regulator [Flavobacteriaceae bacterium AU392]
MQRKLIKESIKKELKAIAEKNQNPLVALYAIYKSDIDDSNIEDQQFIKTFDDKWHSEDNPYFNAYRNTYTMQSSNNYYLVFLSIGAFLLIMGYVFIYVFKKKKSSNNKKQLQSLSIQERKILGLIQQGLSNKEISDECHIELSTVKTHVSNIYSKLNIKSRKDAMGINS